MLLLAFVAPEITTFYPDFVFPCVMGALVAYALWEKPGDAESTVGEEPPSAIGDPLQAEVQQAYDRIHKNE